MSSQIRNQYNRFAISLYQQLAQQKGNLFFSPTSIQIANAMLYAGAKGRTADIIAQVSQFKPLDGDAIHNAFQSKLQSLQNYSGSEVNIAVNNALWVESAYPILKSYQELLQLKYSAQSQNLSFSCDPEAARQMINSTIKQQTSNLIPELFEQGSITTNTVASLTNAIHFKGTWQHTFSKENTYNCSFLTKTNERLSVPTMHLDDIEVAYLETGDFQAVKLPYSDKSVHMLLVKPYNPSHFEQWESEFNIFTLQAIDQEIEVQEDVDIILPKFSVASSYGLKQALSELGMSEAFGTGANWAGITDTEQLILSDVIHKAVVSVDESGTEATAASGSTVECLGMSACFDGRSPFLFFIRDTEGSILFMGRVENPLEK